MLLLLIPVLLIIWGFWWIHKPPAYPKDPDNLTVVGVFLLPADKVERTLLAMYVTALIIPYVPIERGLRRCYDRYGRRIDER